MYRFEVIESGNPKWETIIKSSYIYDFHHTAYYHAIDTDYKCLMFVASRGEDFVAIPLVLRPIEGTEFYDFTSVYGYCGPLSNHEHFNFSEELTLFFRDEFRAYCQDNKIVTAFSRLHPLIEQKTFFEGMGEVKNLNKTVSVDLQLPAEIQRQEYRKSLKSELNQLRRKEYVVAEAGTDEEVEQFIAIYYETMDRVNAARGYYFSKEYFFNFLKAKDFNSKLLVAKWEGKVVAGAIFTYTDKIMQYHLAGTTEEFIKDTPMKLILDEARLMANELKLVHLHLGGGVGGQDDDSLFRFKSGFSKNFKQFSIWKFIVNPEIYDELVSKRGVDGISDFFPLYRA